MDTIREENLRDVSEEGEYKKKMHALRWEVYVKDNKGLIKEIFLVSVPHPKEENIVWTCVKYHIINEKEDYEAILLGEFDYKLFEEEEGVGIREILDGYPYLKHLINFCNLLLPITWPKLN